jgi:DNA-binding SARP family transcriptional activator
LHSSFAVGTVEDVRYRVLGPIEVVDGSRSLPLGGYRQRLVLALLLSRGGHALTTDWLVDAVWGEHPPRAARKTLQVYVARLRGVVGDNAIVTAPGTYRLVLDGAELDAAEFEAAAGRGHTLASFRRDGR